MKTVCGHPQSQPPGLRGRELNSALEAAEAFCAEANEVLTVSRRRVLELLLAAGAAVKAYDLIGAYNQTGGVVAPTTIYRSLEFLERMGFVHRLESLSAFIVCHAARHEHPAAFLICECCGRTHEFAPDLVAQRAAAAVEDFKLERVTLEVLGVCRHCRS
jgi:Fur family zinc uptake transcriptional regulator